MAAEISPVTEENDVITLSDRELLEAIAARLARLEDEMRGLLSAWSAGGLRGLRAAARRGDG